jgi:hypothetical protein
MLIVAPGDILYTEGPCCRMSHPDDLITSSTNQHIPPKEILVLAVLAGSQLAQDIL